MKKILIRARTEAQKIPEIDNPTFTFARQTEVINEGAGENLKHC